MLTEILIAALICITEFTVIVIASPMAKPSLVLRFLPEDVQEAAKNHPEPPLYQQMIAHCLLAVFLLVFLGVIVFLGLDGIRQGYGFWRLAGRFLFVLYLCKLFDILVQDQWLVLRYGYYKKLYPETENCARGIVRGLPPLIPSADTMFKPSSSPSVLLLGTCLLLTGLS